MKHQIIHKIYQTSNKKWESEYFILRELQKSKR